MSEIKHTPGPWHVCPAHKAEHQWVVVNVEGDSIASCEPIGPWMSYAEADANTRLIAAAPKLLEALKAMVGETHVGATFSYRVELARAAIAEAEERAG